MLLPAPLQHDPGAPLSRANPIAKIVAALLLMAVLFLSVDLLTPILALVVLGIAIPLGGVDARGLALRAWPILVIAAAVGIANVAFAGPSGAPAAVELGPLRASMPSLLAGVALALRVVAIALAGLLATVTTEPLDLSDALIQQVGVSPRFAVGTLAALRLLPQLAEQRATIALARRARGVESGRSPVAAVRLFASQLLVLLVVAVRRGSRLALAMEARGLGARKCRSVARPQGMRAGDWTLVGIAALCAGGTVALSVAAGSWRFLLA